MATSGDTSWELTRNQLITRAFAKIGIPGEDNSLSATQISDGAEALNSVISLAVTDGMPLWKRITESETLSTTSQVYTLNNAVKVAAVYLLDSGGVQYPIIEKSLYDFMYLPQDTVSQPVHWTWQPSIQGSTVSIWPLTSDATTVANKTLNIVYQREFDGVVSSTDTLDFPAYWTLALVYKTAVLLAPEYGVPMQDRQQLKAEAKEYWEAANGYGDEEGSLFIQPNRQYK